MGANTANTPAFATGSAAAASTVQTAVRTRQLAIDALRGLVMLFMLIDHVRETFYLYRQVTDPMDALTIQPVLFFTRITSQICAPVFVALTGLSAYLYGQSHSKADVSMFLVKRGAFLIFLELTFVGFAWTFQFPPQTFWLQVIWAIGISMILLAGLIHLPRAWQITVAVAIIALHNLLDGIVLTQGSPFFAIWAILHQRAVIDLGGGLIAKTTYPVLPWIGVILAGYTVGPWFARNSDAGERAKRLLLLGFGMVAAFLALRALNIYGDKPWVYTGEAIRTVMSFLATTKYPPSLLFLLPTLGVGCLLLVLFEKTEDNRAIGMMATLGGAPMFFYLLHLYVLKGMYLAAEAIWGPNKGSYFGFDDVSSIWICAVLMAPLLYIPCRWFANLKQRRKDIWWLRYL